ncbi:DNA-binding transcriptional LysR family regulator [Kineosphaera limosa]|uniref:Putative LysR family transcriptional regulator n=1 Tax=Kineosphaera limosa NBRC 100340 TaxID=1184609 RepID=K6WA00_9MICO|nr:LysR family transcriptional regulator [Kineosphaera limosa]NYE02443.1 DNA-binding transcriptional LysR family regulator [Kineosphaera limosa]GAB96030.1 putative LysR family transcriptional regulator [Kineosphaera limosa NBRC 100340]
MLELRRLAILSALAAEGTMTAAAARLHLTTSAVSQQVALLEKEVGLPLLVRSGRNVVLNEAGQALVGHYAHIAEAVEEAEAHLRTFHSDVRGTIAISTFPSFCSVVLPVALMALRRDHPQLDTSVRDMEPMESIAQLRGGGVDIAVIDDVHEIEGEGIVTVELARDEIVLCAPPEHRPATGPSVQLRDYAQLPWIVDSDGSAFEQFVLSVCRAAGFEPRVVAHCSNLLASFGLVRAGYGVALMSELNLGPATAELVVRRVDPPVQRTILVAMRASSVQAPSVRAVVRALRRATRSRARSGGGEP